MAGTSSLSETPSSEKSTVGKLTDLLKEDTLYNSGTIHAKFLNSSGIEFFNLGYKLCKDVNEYVLEISSSFYNETKEKKRSVRGISSFESLKDLGNKVEEALKDFFGEMESLSICKFCKSIIYKTSPDSKQDYHSECKLGKEIQDLFEIYKKNLNEE